MGTLGTDPYWEIFLIYREKFEKSGFFKNKCMFILRNSQCERWLSCEKGASRWELRRELLGGENGASGWEESLPVGRELPSGKGAFLLRRVLLG